MEMPKQATHLSLDFSSLLGPIFYCWLAQLLLPLFLVTLVYEKQRRSASEVTNPSNSHCPLPMLF